MRYAKSINCIIALLAGIVVCVSCGHSRLSRNLSDIEFLLDSRPDSALVLIRQIDTTSLKGKAAKAKFSLLHAAALDKNYIDTADTRIARPAVDWYDRHGNPEERLKAWMYLGTEQFNGERYNEAIVSFSKAIEDTSEIRDKNLLGLLYSRIAETYTRTREDNIAEIFIDKSISCFLECDRRDQANKELIIKAKNLITQQKWETGDSLLLTLLKDSSITSLQRGRLEGIYAITVLSSPHKDDILAYPHMLRALSLNGRLENEDQYYAYAYLLSLVGKQKLSDSILNQYRNSESHNRYSYYYWKHRIQKNRGDYEAAYRSLWLAKQANDSISKASMARSTANAQRVYMENKAIENELQAQKQQGLILLTVLISFALIMLITMIVLRERRRNIEEQGRMSLAIDSLKRQLDEAKDDMILNGKKKAKARFAYLSDMFEEMYHITEGGVELSTEKLYQIINKQINIVGSDKIAWERFTKALDEETGGIMSGFSKDFPSLTDQEKRLAGYVFAGFDNTTIMLLMGTSTLEHARVKKNRLKKKIEESAIIGKEAYLIYFNNIKKA